MPKWFNPTIVANGILWLVGLAMQISGWVNQCVAIILLTVAFIWSLSFVAYYLKTRPKIGKLQQGLANFIPEGESIRDQCYNQKVKVPEKEAQAWAKKVADFLTINLGKHYYNSFYNSDGLGTAKIPPMYSHEHQRIALFLSYRLMRIQQYLEELRKK